MTDSNKYQEYFERYNNYSKTHKLGKRYLEQGKMVWQTKCCKILYYSSFSDSCDHDIKKRKALKRIFLIAPSIFNSPEILFLSRNNNPNTDKNKSFADNLKKLGDIYIIDWLDGCNSHYLLENYVQEIVSIINELQKVNIAPINLIGHCIGGNLALAANIIAPEAIKTLTLLTTPWDFSHFLYVRQIHKHLRLDHNIENLSVVPKIHIQILFFLLFPNHFNTKLDNFFSMISDEEQELTFRIENWLMSGNNISRATYCQLLENILDENMFVKKQWQIEDKVIDASLIKQPVYIVAANNDRIVPRSSILPLHVAIKNSKLFEVDSGHISYLINDKLANLFKEYTL